MDTEENVAKDDDDEEPLCSDDDDKDDDGEEGINDIVICQFDRVGHQARAHVCMRAYGTRNNKVDVKQA